MQKQNCVAVFGLGSMGYGIGQSLLRAGNDVFGFDVAKSQCDRFEKEGGKTATVAETGPQIDTAVIVVLNAAQLESVLFGEDGIVPHMRSGACVIA
jgi:3-hydroxyisobutyrate dehydrogenase-like beta-hydroxyacid dehydrogenase